MANKNRRFERLEVQFDGSRPLYMTNGSYEMNNQYSPVDTLVNGRAGYTQGCPFISLSGTLSVSATDSDTADLVYKIFNKEDVDIVFPIGGGVPASFVGTPMTASGQQAANGNYEITVTFEGSGDGSAEL